MTDLYYDSTIYFNVFFVIRLVVRIITVVLLFITLPLLSSSLSTSFYVTLLLALKVFKRPRNFIDFRHLENAHLINQLTHFVLLQQYVYEYNITCVSNMTHQTVFRNYTRVSASRKKCVQNVQEGTFQQITIIILLLVYKYKYTYTCVQSHCILQS